MRRYVQQLIDDLKQAELNPMEREFWDSDEEFTKAILEMLENDDRVPLEHKIGVSYDELPEAGMLSEEELRQLLEAMLNALAANGAYVTLPEGAVPQELIYTELKKEIKDGVYPIHGWSIDFCSGDCDGCPFENYCELKDDLKDIADQTNINKK